MAYRKAELKDFEGKTISGVDSSSVNVLKLSFTDGTALELWAEDVLYTEAGYIPGIFVDDPSLKEEVSGKLKLTLVQANSKMMLVGAT
jgi:hypothetical protein